MSELIALLNEREVGTVRQDHGRLSFEYADSWRNAADSYPLSMPLRPRGMNMRRSRSFYGGCCPTTSSSLANGAGAFTSRRATHSPCLPMSGKIAPGPSSSSAANGWMRF